MKRSLWIIYIFCSLLTQAQNDSSKTELPTIMLRFGLYDQPYMNYAAGTISYPNSPSTNDYFRGYANPGMDKAMQVSNSLYTALHFSAKRLIRIKNKFLNKYLSNLTAGVGDIILLYTPLGSGWLHEEYHRSMMNLHYVNSFDDMNTFPFGKQVVSVHSEKDTDLVRMKAESNPDFVRMMEAGIEGQYNQIRQLQKENFFYQQDLPHTFLYLSSTINSIFYVMTCSMNSANELTNKMESEESTDISKRDFTGLDFNAWTYDLFHPDEPYQNRGAHPSGNGIRRYIRPSDMTPEELTYLRNQGYYQLINMLSPAITSFNSVKLKRIKRGDYYGNFALRHLLTSFGCDFSGDIFLKTPKHNWFFSGHVYQNKNTTFGGLEAELFDEAIQLRKNKMYITSRVMAWTQPSKQSFFSETQQLGGLAAVTIDLPITRNLYFSITGKIKSQGWVMGETFLNENASFLVGIRTNFYRK